MSLSKWVSLQCKNQFLLWQLAFFTKQIMRVLFRWMHKKNLLTILYRTINPRAKRACNQIRLKYLNAFQWYSQFKE